MSDLLMRLDEAANDTHFIDHETAREAAARIRELEAQLAAPVAVKVKPLVWEAGARDQRRADSIVGEFCVTFFGGRWFYKGEPRGGMLAAQAAAQADYDARILSAVEAVPVAEVWRRAIEAVVAEIRQWDDYSISGRDLAIDRLRALPVPADLGVRHD